MYPHYTTNSLSSRETEILLLISEEHTMKEIAALLFISQHTVISHRKNLLAKMAARNTAGLIRRAFEAGMLQPN